ncbi:hypothetical protein BD770DRAFT_378013 [Pilaira anomala]|nr:hypothetical protein BD770DRAFT_378013 [Pilaira anomala]
MTPLGKWFNRPRRHSSPTSRLNEFMNISAATNNKRNNTFPPTTTKSTTTTTVPPQSVPQRAPMLITTSFYNQAYPFEIYDNDSTTEESYHPTATTTQPLNIPIKNKSHHLEDDDDQFNSYRATNQRTPTPYHVSERYEEQEEEEEDGKTFSGIDIAGFEKLQEAFKKLEKKHKKKEKKIQELEYLLYSKSLETQQQQQQHKSSEYQTIPLSNSYYAGYYEPYYGYNYYSPSSYYYSTSNSSSHHHHHELRHTKQSQYRYDKGPNYYSQQQYYQRSTL